MSMGSPGSSSSSRQQTSRDMRLINAALELDEGDGGDDDDALFAVHRRGLLTASATHSTPPPAARSHRTPQHRSDSLHQQLSPSASLPPPSPSASASLSSPSSHSVSARQAALDRLRALESSSATSSAEGGGGALLHVAVAASASPSGRGHFSESPRRSSNRTADSSPTLAPPPSSSLSSSLRRSFAPPTESPNVGGSALSFSLVGALRLSTAAAAPLAASVHANRMLPLPPHAAAARTDADFQYGAMGSSPFALRGSLNQSMMAALAASASASAPRLNSARK
jgi:hypothetical protein